MLEWGAVPKYLIACLGLGLLTLATLAEQADVKPLTPTNVPVNTGKDEDDPHVSTNGLTLLYVRDTGKRYELMAATRKAATDPWTPGQPLTDIKSKESDFRSPFLTADGKYPQRLYYSSNMDPLTKGAKGDNHDIYYLVKLDAGSNFGSYNALVSVGTEVDETHPWITADEQDVYFSRKTEGGWRQFVASKPKDGGQFGVPTQVKLPLGFHHATLTPDGKTMYLQGPVASNTKGRRWGLYVSTSLGKGMWSKPEPLEGLNQTLSQQGDMSPALSGDGATLYFVSDRAGGKGGLDIWSIPTAQLKR